jgi:hypothetical protein
MAGLDDFRRTHRGAGTALAHQMQPLVELLNDATTNSRTEIKGETIVNK